MGSVRRRLEVLEDRMPLPKPPGRTEAQARMRAYLDQVARLRRGELSEEEEAEVEAESVAVERRLAEIRGEGGS